MSQSVLIALVALAGTLLGAAISTAGTVWQVRVQDRRASEERRDARHARLFDHRRVAYAAFIAEARRLSDWILNGRTGGRATSEPGGDDWNPLADRLADVQLYGSTSAARLAESIQTSLFMATTEQGFDLDLLLTGLDAFVDQARADLGITHDAGLAAARDPTPARDDERARGTP